MLFFLLFRFFLEKTKPVLFYRIHLILYCPLPHSLFNIMEMKKWKICWWCFLCQSRLSIALECPSHICVCVCGRYKYIMEMVGIFVSIKWLILANCVIFITGISGRFSQTMHQFIIACGWPLYEDYGSMTMNTSSCNGNLITLILAKWIFSIWTLYLFRADAIERYVGRGWHERSVCGCDNRVPNSLLSLKIIAWNWP